MKTAWTKGLNAQERDEMSSSYAASAHVRNRLVTLINDKVTSLRRETLSVDKYNSPGWAYLQADAVGYERAMNEIISLISTSSSVAKE